MYTRENFQRAREIIENRRRAAEDMANARNAEVRLISKEIEDIDNELTKTGLELFRIACAGGNIEPLKVRNQELVERRRDILEKLGLGRDYTDLKCTCSMCMDTGYSENNICKCMRELIVTMNIESSGMGHIIDKQSFDNFDLEWYRQSGEDVYQRMAYNFNVAKDYAENFGNRARNLLLIGTTGTGKTHISSSIAKTVISKGYEVVYETIENILDAFRTDRFHRDYRSNELEAEKYLTADLLIIDDLGTELQGNFSSSTLYNLINTRQNRNLSTIISSNLSAEELAGKYEGRFYSRIIGCDYTVLFFTGRDHRVFN